MHYFFITFLILYIYFVRLALPQFNSALSPWISFWAIKSTIIQTSELYDALSFPCDLMKKTDGLDVGGSLEITQLLIEVRLMFIGRNTRRFVPNDIACISQWIHLKWTYTIVDDKLKRIFKKYFSQNKWLEIFFVDCLFSCIAQFAEEERGLPSFAKWLIEFSQAARSQTIKMFACLILLDAIKSAFSDRSHNTTELLHCSSNGLYKNMLEKERICISVLFVNKNVDKCMKLKSK